EGGAPGWREEGVGGEVAGGGVGGDEARVRAFHDDLELCSLRSRLAQQLLGGGAERFGVLARRETDRELGGGLDAERRVADARLAADDPVDVRRRLGPGADVELLAGLRIEWLRARFRDSLRTPRQL